MELIGSEVYGEFEAEARERLDQRDPEDWPMLAAALALAQSGRKTQISSGVA